MFKKGVSTPKNRSHRHVSTNSSYRVYQHLGSKLILLLVFLSFGVQAEFSPSDAVVTLKETEVRREPYPDSESLGILPVKSLVTLTGDERSGFTEIIIELEEGDLTGWVETSAVKNDEIVEEEEPVKKKYIQVRRKRKRRRRVIDVPVDEGVLLGRKTTFSYGALLGFHLDQLSIEDPEGTATGNGITGGISLSFVLDPSFKFRPEITYSSHAGIDENDRLISFSFFDIAALGEFPINKDFFIFAGLQYSMGTGLDNSENAVSPLILEESSEVSGLWGQLGAGYKFSVGENSFLSLRANYRGAFMISPVGFHVFGIQALFEIEG